MKCWLKNNPVYHKVYEYTEAGTYTITITKDTPCKFVIVGGGGGGAYAHAGYFQTDGYDGAGGTATAVDGSIGTNGRTGDTVGIYKNQYGAGGVNSASNGFAGYAMIDIISDSSDYTYTVDDFTAKVVDDNGTYKAFRR